MRGWVQDFIHAVLGAACAGAPVTATGGTGKQIAMTAATGAAIAVWHLYTEKNH